MAANRSEVVRCLHLGFPISAGDPVLVEDELAGILVRLVHVVIDAALLDARRGNECLQHVASFFSRPGLALSVAMTVSGRSDGL